MTGSSRAAEFLRTGSGLKIALVSAAAYYIGSLIGLELRLPPSTPSVIWPPNSILTVLLLFVPLMRWWSVLLGAGAAHFAVQLPVWSPGFVTAIFATHCTEALIAAFVIRCFSDKPSQFDTLRRVSIFLIAAGLQSTDVLKSGILNSIPSLVAVIGADGRIMAANESWREAREKGVMADLSSEPGASYLDVWAAAADRDVPLADAAYVGIKSVLDGTSSRFALEYCFETRAGGQWWMMSVVPLRSPGGGAVVTHTDITARKRAEVEAQQSRDELAHVTRDTPPNVVEVRHILTDIIADTQRASDVTRAIREMLKKDVSEDELLDVNDIVRDTTTLVTSEAIIRNVSLRLQPAPSLPRVQGKRVQLRQVVLNLTMNAMEAMNGHTSAETKSVIVRTEPGNVTGVQVSVIDTGCGLPVDGEEQVFEPFFTTKESGMGMGLPIARAIVEAHGVTISADGSAAGKTIFRLTLPASVQQVAP